ncbi:MAG: nucleotidyltransferase domain-containing protein [candidate division KSB1 bacterium]|nr:nucleotidyltransferase domain-containing protein [candidate division KSB1 bacterium]MDZ7365530.1 nucleotidyltransferase domain-containing protein [candidate division KSB1 bacterium]MDZ7403633.1 nucleotidyltransferase domain-containing protein [candidate division KSB1 bacterium]
MVKKTSTIFRAIRKYILALQESGTHVQQVFLYGSHAKNQAHRDSDIDIIVVSENFKGKELLERLHILGRARRNVPEPVEAYGFTPEEVENRERDLSAFWEEIIDTEAIPITNQVLTPQKKKRKSKRRKPALLRQ